jgi:ornithine cyclodeaminase/alanine dehydrogenase-like protein (mu-crystallin family)
VAAEADILITATTSREPVIRADAIKAGTHINAVGNFFPDCRELDGETVAACARYVDDMPSALLEAGELILAAEEGLIPEGAAGIAGDLSSLVTGLTEGRTDRGQLTLFKSVGTALSDLACLLAAAEVAEARDLGTLVEG